DGIRDFHVTGVQTCALPIWSRTLRISDLSAREQWILYLLLMRRICKRLEYPAATRPKSDDRCRRSFRMRLSTRSIPVTRERYRFGYKLRQSLSLLAGARV